jgi:glycogen debranching enzyme
MQKKCVTSVRYRFALGAVFSLVLISVTNMTAAAQQWLQPVPQFPLASSDLTIRQHAEALKPFTVAGECGTFVGQQDGSFEAWVFPIKLLSHFHIQAEIQNYTVPIDLNEQAAEVEVAPDHTTITYSHAAFTVREILFATPCSSNGTGVMALFHIDAVRPMKLTFSFTPEVKRMWPASNYNAPYPEWVKQGESGYYILHTDSDDLAGAIGMPGTQPGILAPYQERPKFWPLQMILNFDPKRDGDKYFPLLMAVGNNAETAKRTALAQQLEQLNEQAPQLYAQTADYYKHFFDKRLVADTPDRKLNEALGWAEIAIDQLRVRHGDEVGLVAGFYSSGDSNRPGFGWFFGRDTLYTLFAVNSYGDFTLTRQALEFLMKRQRDDGKIMHEYSQTAELVDWKSLPYEYAAADATPLFLMAMEDYVKTSGDTEFLRQHWETAEKAWQFEHTHDTDGDGIYDNSQGTGWVESWPSGMPHQEVYMAALDVQASGAFARLARIMNRTDDAVAAEARSKKVAETLEQEYAGSMYAFSRSADGSLDKTATIYPSVAWWDGHYALKQPDAMFKRWASHEFSTDWGLRDLGENETFYDPLSYHQGSVWPLFTGWASIAEYRTGRTLSAYAHLMQNADLTWAQDLGSVTELLSGAYFQPFGRSTTHQLWSSAMVLAPAIRGLFGVSFDAAQETLSIDPHLPADWDHAILRHVPAGHELVDLEFKRDGGFLLVHASDSKLKLDGPHGVSGRNGELRIPLSGVEVDIPHELPLPGARTAQLKVPDQTADGHSLTLGLEAQGGSTYDLPLRFNGLKNVAHADGATILPPTDARGLSRLHVVFPTGAGYQQQTVRLTW